ncbi:hypothetical protein MesoLj131c_67930 (plasmid) [Mesorhizobium sp. 131-3-5]|nr:hypothetical protein MesoLj131c_67780 [Mesorhizobium sp. 131-3-5]BCH12535.1 hypothetical protein MesoLj131c_67930 [Mesorhizobium sp. 131-3-5]
MLIHCFVPEPCNRAGASGESRVPAFVERSRLGQDNPDNARHLGGKCDNSFVRVHTALQPVKPASQAIPGSIQVTEA